MAGRIDMEAPWTWLALGWADLWHRPALSIGYGLACVGASYALTAGLLVFDLGAVVLPLAAGFLLLGPMLAVGLYELSRRYETGAPIRMAEIVFVSARSPSQLALLGIVLMLLLLFWLQLATLLFAVFFGAGGIPPLSTIVPALLLTWQGLALLIVGSILGGALATVAFALSAISVPLLLDREIDVVSAMGLSVRAVLDNPKPMALWAWLIAVLITVGIVTGYFGLAIAFPLIGHATWHAYRSFN